MSSSLPLSRETPSEPFGRPRFLPEALAGALRNQVTLDLGEQREEGGHDFGLDVALALDANVLLQRHEGDACLGEGVEDGDDLTQRPTEPGEFADDQTDPAGDFCTSESERESHGGGQDRCQCRGTNRNRS